MRTTGIDPGQQDIGIAITMKSMMAALQVGQTMGGVRSQTGHTTLIGQATDPTDPPIKAAEAILIDRLDLVESGMSTLPSAPGGGLPQQTDLA